MDLRKEFFNFFEKKGHKVVKSSSLLPTDPSVLLTTAGVQQFKDYFTGKKDPEKDFGSHRVISSQKCFRTSDIDEVGDETHLTFFEMLGNFSFGPVGTDNPEDFDKNTGYFKRSAIYWAWEFLKHVINIENREFFITIFEGNREVPFDQESFDIWHKEIGIPEEKIKRLGLEDNFWGPTGLEGPCGPTTEIHVEGVEIWNLVFNQYYKHQDGSLDLLESQGIDTGSGLERLLKTVERKENIFETSLFKPIFLEIEKNSNNLNEKVKRILADHLRASAFLISDGVEPSNKETGYVLRRLLRRVITYGNLYKFDFSLIKNVLEIVIKNYQDYYKELFNNQDKIIETVKQENEKFQKTLKKGLLQLEKFKRVTGKEAFYLYESFGLPFEIIKEIYPEKAKDLKYKDFEKEFKKHQEISRKGAVIKFGGHGISDKMNSEDIEKITKLHTATHLLQAALRKVLGEHIKQMGSDINPERLRFDFSHSEKLTSEQIKQIEDLINEKISQGLAVESKEMAYQEAIKSGALAFFKAKYPERVSVYTIFDPKTKEIFSREICAGPHVKNISELGKFKILKEESISAGVRRIKAILE